MAKTMMTIEYQRFIEDGDDMIRVLLYDAKGNMISGFSAIADIVGIEALMDKVSDELEEVLDVR